MWKMWYVSTTELVSDQKLTATFHRKYCTYILGNGTRSTYFTGTADSSREHDYASFHSLKMVVVPYFWP